MSVPATPLQTAFAALLLALQAANHHARTRAVFLELAFIRLAAEQVAGLDGEERP